MQRTTSKKLDILSKYFLIKDDTIANISLNKNGKVKKLKIVIPTDFKTFKSEVANLSYYDALDRAVDILERQIRQEKEKIQRRSDRGAEDDVYEDDEVFLPEKAVVKEKLVFLDKISREKAIDTMNELGHDFFVYIDEDLEKPCVLYIRHDGDYGVLVCC